MRSKADVVVILGAAGAGKDTAADAIFSDMGGENLKFAAPLKDMCANLFGWDRVRLDTDLEYKESVGFYPDGSACMTVAGESQTRRQVLQRLGTDIFRAQVNEGIWLQAALVKAAASDTHLFVATDCRFNNELEFIQNNFHNVLVIRVEREGAGGGTAASAHISERQALEMPVDVTISAKAGEIKDLQCRVVAVVKEWRQSQ